MHSGIQGRRATDSIEDVEGQVGVIEADLVFVRGKARERQLMAYQEVIQEPELPVTY